MIPAGARGVVRCSSTDKGAEVRKACSVGCIGCKRCEKACEYDAIHVSDFLARIDVRKCVGCGACADVCPVDCIDIFGYQPKRQQKAAAAVNIKPPQSSCGGFLWALNIGHLICEYRELF